jgi:hypothetical protein
MDGSTRLAEYVVIPTISGPESLNGPASNNVFENCKNRGYVMADGEKEVTEDKGVRAGRKSNSINCGVG